MTFCGDNVRDSIPLFRKGSGGVIPTSPLHLRDFRLNVCKPQRACELNKLWHSRFPIIDWSNVVRNTHSICYTYDLDDYAYAVAIWSTPIAANRLKDGWKLLELRRMAIDDNAPDNTASKMISLMIRDIRKRFPDVIKLISYQDTESHKGTIYKASNWIACEQGKNVDWTNEKRKRNKQQSSAPKIRWEYQL